MPRVGARSSASRGEASSPPKPRPAQSPVRRSTRSGRSRSHSLQPEVAVSTAKATTRVTRQASVESTESAASVAGSRRSTRSKKTRRAPVLDRDLSIVSEHSENEDIRSDSQEGRDPPPLLERYQSSVATAITSWSEDETRAMNPSDIADYLPDLFKNSKRHLDLLAPKSGLKEEDVAAIANELKITGSRLALQLKKSEDHLKLTKESYGSEAYIRTSYVLTKLVGSEVESNGNWRPDHVLYAANLATFVADMLLLIKESQHTVSTLQGVCQIFPTEFVVMPHDDSEIFRSDLENLTFDLALKLYTQWTIARLASMNFDTETPDQVLVSGFFESVPDPDTWDPKASYKVMAQGLTMKNLVQSDEKYTPDQVDMVWKTLESISQSFRTGDDAIKADDRVDFDLLEETFPWIEFITAAVNWSRLRFEELCDTVKQRGGIDEITQSLKKFLEPAHSQASRDSSQAPKADQHPKSVSPRSMETYSFWNQIRSRTSGGGAVAQSSSHPHPPSGQASRIADPAKGRASSPELMQQIADNPLSRMGNESDDTADERPRPTSEYTAAWNENIKEKNKENQKPAAKPVARRRMIDPQPDAKRISNDWDLSQTEVDRPAAPKRSRTESEESEDQGFQEDDRRLYLQRKATVPPARPFSPTEEENQPPPKQARVDRRHTNTQAGFSSAAVRRRGRERAARDDEEASDDEYQDDGPPAATAIDSTQVAIAARLSAARMKGQGVPKGRTPWSKTDDDLLIESIAEYGCRWSWINQTQNFEDYRGQVALKDRARTLKVQYLKSGTPLPVGFEAVPLGKKEKAAVEAIIITAVVVCFLLWQQLCDAQFATQAREVAGMPQYVLDYAPLVWLHEGEAYFPSDMFAQVQNTHPDVNLTTIGNPPLTTLENLDVLNAYGNHGRDVYLTSNIDVTTQPIWLTGIVPDSTGKTHNVTSSAIIVNDRGNGTVDAFYMYFYAYNQGSTVFFRELGDHIGDWEHNMIRFQDGQPQAVWFSQHNNGQAFTYKAVEKKHIRPVAYSAIGSHANYAVKGTHDHLIPDLNLPAGFLQDYTSQGTLWDPTLSAFFYLFNGTSSTFVGLEESPVGAMHYRGRWGDMEYPDYDKRQPPPFFGFRKFVSGPTGPWDKQLNRTKICPDNGILCIVREILVP